MNTGPSGADAMRGGESTNRLSSNHNHAGRPAPKANGEALLQNVVDSIPFDVFACDKNGRIILQNRASREHYGGLLGNRPSDLGLDAVSLVAWNQLMRRALAGNRAAEEMTLDTAGHRKHYQVIMSPLTDDTGEVRGALAIHVDISERKRAELHLREMAFYDHLTGVYNRRAFFTLGQQQLRSARQTDTALALVFFRVQGIDAINESSGHRAGDEALGVVANLLCQVFGDSDIISRVDGVEFAVLALARPETNLPGILNRLHAQVDRYNRASRRPGGVSLDVGITSVTPDNSTTLETLFHAAGDRARSKSAHGQGKCA